VYDGKIVGPKITNCKNDHENNYAQNVNILKEPLLETDADNEVPFAFKLVNVEKNFVSRLSY
jgi:hypothetical protein